MPILPAARSCSFASTSGKSRAYRYPPTINRLPTIFADVRIPHLLRASWPSQSGRKSTAIPSSDGNAASAAVRFRVTLCPRDPLGARSLGTSTRVNTPSNGIRFGCPWMAGNSTAIASSLMCSPVFLVGYVGVLRTVVAARDLGPVAEPMIRFLYFVDPMQLSLFPAPVPMVVTPAAPSLRPRSISRLSARLFESAPFPSHLQHRDR